MLFNIIIFILFAAIAYFHYAQGLFSAMISAIICILASALAIGYHELLTPYLMKVMPEEAVAVAILGIFIIAYVVPRLIMDSLLPGNVRFPLLLDKIGAGVMGAVAGLFASGVFAVAAQSMPFGPSIGGYSRQVIQDRPNVTIGAYANASGRNMDTSVMDELVGDRLGDPSHASALWLHQDDLVVGFARQLSDAGNALSDDHPLEDVHPDYLTELFGQRLGIPLGSRRLAINTPQITTMKVSTAYRLAKPPASMDNELPSVRGDMSTPEIPPPSDFTLAVLRVTFSPNPDATDSDGLLRFSPAALRLKAGTTDYYPVGTMVGGVLLLKNRPDDPLMVNLQKSPQNVDFLFIVPNDDLSVRTEGKEKKVSFKPDSFVEFKRCAQQDLHGMELAASAPPTPVEAPGTDSILGGLIRKTYVVEEAMKNISPAAAAAAQAQKSAAPKAAPGRANSPPRNNSQDLLPDLPNHQIGL